MDKGRDHTIDLAKGVGILLVVLGHIAPASSPEFAWWNVCSAYIYTFHMPCFLFLSGFTAAKYSRSIVQGCDFFQLTWKKAYRLMLPHLLFALLVFGLKYKVGEITTNQLSLKTFTMVYWDPMRSHAQFLWFIYFLFLFALITPWLLSALRIQRVLIILATLAFYILSVADSARIPSYSLFLTIAQYFPFYLAGLWCFGLQSRIAFNFMCYLFMLGFCVCSCLYVDGHPNSTYLAILKHLIGWFSLAFVAVWLRRSYFHFSHILLKGVAAIGAFSFPIYLMNTTIIGGVKVVLVKLGVVWTAAMLPWHILAAFSLAVAIPMIIQFFVFERIPVLREIFRR